MGKLAAGSGDLSFRTSRGDFVNVSSLALVGSITHRCFINLLRIISPDQILPKNQSVYGNIFADLQHKGDFGIIGRETT